MAIKRRESQQETSPATTENDELEKRAEAFGRGAYSPVKEVPETELDPTAPIGPQGILFRYNDYQKALLKESADQDRRSIQKLLESIVWPELERRRSERRS